MKRGLACLLCCCVLAATTSCSILFVKPPPADHPTAADDCTESRVAPVLDTAYVGLTAFLMLFLVGRCTQTGGTHQDGTPNTGCTTSQWAATAWAGALGLGVAYSAYTGYRDTGRCRDRRALEAPVAPIAQTH